MTNFDREKSVRDIEQLRKQVDAAEKLRTEATAKKNLHEEEIKKKEAELKALGVNDPSKADETLEKLIAEYNELMAKAQAAIPASILERAQNVR